MSPIRERGEYSVIPEHSVTKEMKLERLRRVLTSDNMKPEEYEKYLEGIVKEAQDISLGWTNETATLEKINDVEVFMASGFDEEFMVQHHAVRDLLAANSDLGGPLKIADIYEALRAGCDGTEAGKGIIGRVKNPDGTERIVDLYDQVHIKRIVDYFETLHPEDKMVSGLNRNTIEELYREGEPISISITQRDEQGRIILGTDGEPQKITISDLAQYEEKIPRLTVHKGEFNKYHETIQNHQTGFQWLSTLRDPSIAGHHAENAGHAQLLEGLDGKYYYVPVDAKSAAKYARGDVSKMGPSFLSENHPHEVGHYEEGTGLLVWVEKDAYVKWRGSVTDFRIHEKTKPRTMNNLMGMNSDESAMVDKNTRTFWFGKRDKGGGIFEKGAIYTAMHNEHNLIMKKNRGYGLTEEEAGDKVLTDVIGKVFALNQRDWLMSMARASGGMYTPHDVFGPAFIENDENGKPEFVFYALKPAGVTSVDKDQSYGDGPLEYGEIKFLGVTAFAKYINWRIKRGDIPEVTELVEADFLHKIRKEHESKKKKEEKDGETQEAEEDKKKMDSRQYAKSLGSFVSNMFGERAQKVLDAIIAKERAEITINGESVVIRDEASLGEAIKKCMGMYRDEDGILRMKPETHKVPENDPRFITSEEKELRDLAQAIAGGSEGYRTPAEAGPYIAKMLYRLIAGLDKLTIYDLMKELD